MVLSSALLLAAAFALGRRRERRRFALALGRDLGGRGLALDVVSRGGGGGGRSGGGGGDRRGGGVGRRRSFAARPFLLVHLRRSIGKNILNKKLGKNPFPVTAW